jgi:hypothetical protein
MSELDLLKEKIAYLKVLFGIFVVTAISLIGWMASNFVAATIWMQSASIFAMMVLLLVIFGLHRRIERLIEQLRDG